jgi:hypothetical protein
MKTYPVLMSDSTEHMVDLVFRGGAALAEVRSLIYVPFYDLYFPDESDRQGGIQRCERCLRGTIIIMALLDPLTLTPSIAGD